MSSMRVIFSYIIIDYEDPRASLYMASFAKVEIEIVHAHCWSSYSLFIFSFTSASPLPLGSNDHIQLCQKQVSCSVISKCNNMLTCIHL